MSKDLKDFIKHQDIRLMTDYQLELYLQEVRGEYHVIEELYSAKRISPDYLNSWKYTGKMFEELPQGKRMEIASMEPKAMLREICVVWLFMKVRDML